VTGQVSFVKEFDPKSSDAFFKEQAVFTSVVHPAVLGMIGFVFPTESTPAKIVTELMPYGSLDQLLSDRKKYAALSPTAKVKIVVGIVYGLHYLHRCGFAHGDLNPANVLLDEHDEVRIGGLRRAVLVGPEGCRGSCASMANVCSFGLVLWEILTGNRLAGAFGKGKQFTPQEVPFGRRPSIDGVNETAVELIIMCWETEPEDRGGDFEFISEYLKEYAYDLLTGVAVQEIESYVERIEDYERRVPARRVVDNE
jgi:serine/threonine protein kinase